MKISLLSKKILSVSLAAAASVSCFGINVMAAGQSDPSFVEVCDYYGNTDFAASNYQDLIKYLTDCYLSHEKEIDISDYGFPANMVSRLHMAVLKSTPELFFVSNTINYTSRNVNGGTIIIDMIPNYSMSKSESDRMIGEFHSAADFYLDQLDENLSMCNDEFSKAALLHDELVLENHYQINGASIYTFMKNHFGKCEDYTRVYAYLLGQVGIYTEIVASDPLTHEWLRARIDGKYYNVDVTWDDPVPDKPGQVQHTYFLYSDESDSRHYGFFYINDTDKKYDNMLFHNYNSKLCKVSPSEKAVFAVDRAEKKIVKYNYANNTAETVIDLNDITWKSDGNKFWREAFSGLDMYDGLLYYNTPDAIYSYDPASKKTVKVAGNTYSQQYFGLRMRNGTLYGIISESPNVSGQEVYIKNLSKKIEVTGISLSKTSATINKGSSITLTANITPYEATNKSVTWSTSNSKVATVQNGKVTGVSAGTATITAKSSNGKTASCKVTVNVPVIAPTGINLNSSAMSLGKGETTKLTATVLPADASDKSVKWRTSDSKVLTVDQNGSVKAVNNGTAWITARTANGKEKSCKITVKNAPQKITLTKGILTIGVGESYTLGSSVNEGAACSKRTYRTSNSSIVKMTRTDWNGVFYGVKPGVAYVTVRTYNGKESTCKVTVKAAPTSVTISKKALTLRVGQTASLSCSIPSDSGCATRTFRTSNSNIVKMTKTNWTGDFKAIAPGTAYVTVRTYNGKESSCKVTVVKS